MSRVIASSQRMEACGLASRSRKRCSIGTFPAWSVPHHPVNSPCRAPTGGYQPVLLETFVETPRFTGTAYRAANWIRLGQTQGRSKLEKQHSQIVPLKDIWVYPLHRNFRKILCAPA